MGFWMARRTKRLWSDEEKRSICFQTTAPDVSVAQVARRYAMNANLIFKWLRDPRFAPEPVLASTDAPFFLPVEIVEQTSFEDGPPVAEATGAEGTIEIELIGGHRLRISGAYDPKALAHLICGLSG